MIYKAKRFETNELMEYPQQTKQHDIGKINVS